MGEKVLKNATLFILAYPSSCGWNGTTYAFISFENKVYKFQSNVIPNPQALNDPALTILLSSLTFNGDAGNVGSFDIPQQWMQFPSLVEAVTCPT